MKLWMDKGWSHEWIIDKVMNEMGWIHEWIRNEAMNKDWIKLRKNK